MEPKLHNSNPVEDLRDGRTFFPLNPQRTKYKAARPECDVGVYRR